VQCAKDESDHLEEHLQKQREGRNPPSYAEAVFPEEDPFKSARLGRAAPANLGREIARVVIFGGQTQLNLRLHRASFKNNPVC
jgi:hypothetical protein